MKDFEKIMEKLETIEQKQNEIGDDVDLLVQDILADEDRKKNNPFLLAAERARLRKKKEAEEKKKAEEEAQKVMEEAMLALGAKECPVTGRLVLPESEGHTFENCEDNWAQQNKICKNFIPGISDWSRPFKQGVGCGHHIDMFGER